MRVFDWEYLPFFLAVARAGSLRAAAQLVGANYSTVNRNINALEASYGVRLFHRSRAGFSLTEFGEALLPAAEEAERKITAARKKVEGLDKSEAGKIRFSMTPTLAYDFVAPLIARFSALYPDIDVELRLTSEVESITDDETDISLRAAKEVFDDVVARKVFQLNIAVYASQSYVDGAIKKAPEGGKGLTWIGSSVPGSQQGSGLPAEFRDANVRHEVMDGYMRARLVNQGLGMSHLPTLFESVFPDLRRVEGTEVFAGPWLWLLLHSDLRKTVRVRRFVDFMSAELQALNKSL